LKIRERQRRPAQAGVTFFYRRNKVLDPLRINVTTTLNRNINAMKLHHLSALLCAVVPLLHAGRPLQLDDAGPVPPREFEFEAGTTVRKSGDAGHFDFPVGLTAGLPGHLEIGLGFGGQIEERVEPTHQHHTDTGLGDLTVGTKWNFLTADRAWADQATAFTVKIPTASHADGFGSGEVDFDWTYILTINLRDRWNLDWNVGYTWVGDPPRENLDDSVHYGLAVRWQTSDRLEGVAELVADTPVTAEQQTILSLNGGVRWQAREALLLDAAAGLGLRGDGPDWMVTLGFTWAFAFNRDK